MKANRKADLQRKLTLRVVPTPPAGLAERIKSDIPKHLPTATELDRRRLNTAVAFNMRVAASVLLLVGSLFFALHLLNSAYVQEEKRMASFDEALQKNTAPGRDVSPLPKQARSEPQVVTSTEQPPKVVAPPQPARPAIAKQERQVAQGRVQIAEADNGPRRQLRDERKDRAKDNDQKTKEETTKAANELKDLGYLDKTQAQPGAKPAGSAYDRAPATAAAGGSKPAPAAVPSPQPAAPPPPAGSYAYSAPKPPAPVTAANAAPVPEPESRVAAAPAPSESRASSRKKAAPATPPAEAVPPPSTANGAVVVTAEAPMLETKTSRKKTPSQADFVGSAQAADLAIGAPSTVFGYALAGKSLDAAPLVQRFTAPEHRPLHGVQMAADAAPAPLDATKRVLRVSIDTALVSGELGASPAPVAADVQWEVELDPAAVVSHRAVTGDPAKSEHALVEGVSVTALYELELKPSLPRRTHVATVRLRYRSLPDGRERTLTRDVYVRDIAASWDDASVRTKRAALAAAFAEAHARGDDTSAIVEKARAMGFDALAALAGHGSS